MSEQMQEILDIPKDFFKDGTQFINRCTKRMSLNLHSSMITDADAPYSRSAGVYQD